MTLYRGNREGRQIPYTSQDKWYYEYNKVSEESVAHPTVGQPWSGSTVAVVVVCVMGTILLIALLVHYCCLRPPRPRHVVAPAVANTPRPAYPRQQHATVTVNSERGMDLLYVPVSGSPCGYPSGAPYPAESGVCLAPLPAAATTAPDNNDQPPPYEQVVGNCPPPYYPAIHQK